VVELNAANAVDYLKRRGMELDHPRISELGGGVSNTVLLVESGAPPFVLKQALGKLRVEQEWLADRNRVFRESAALERLSGQLPRGSLPEVLFVDQENFAFAMSAAPAAAACWKDLLLRGEVRVETAQQVGGLLARDLRHVIDAGKRGLVSGDAMAADAHGMGVFHAQLLDACRRFFLVGWRLGLRKRRGGAEGKRRTEK